MLESVSVHVYACTCVHLYKNTFTQVYTYLHKFTSKLHLNMSEYINRYEIGITQIQKLFDNSS